MLSYIVVWTILIVPWLTLLLLNRKQVKYFMPVGILSSFLMTIYNIVAYNQKHWIIKVNIIPCLKPLFVPGILGLYLVITIWIFHFTNLHFWIYLIANIVIDFIFTVFPAHYILENKLGIYQLVNITPWMRWLLFVMFSIVLYGYQKWQEEVFKPA